MSPQEEFDTKYITSTEICQSLGVTRASVVNARNRGVLPAPVQINRPNGDPHIMFWLREEVAPLLTQWQEHLEAKRSAA